MTDLRRLAGPLAIALLVVACTGAAAPSASAPPRSTDPGTTPPTMTDPGSGHAGSSDPNAPIGTIIPPAGGGNGSGGSGGSGTGGGDPEVPKPGQLDIHPVRLDSLSASVSGHHVVITANWVSGVEPCSTLDSIIVATGARTFTLTVREGHGAGDVMCIDIAKFKHALVDLGDLGPGTYTIADSQGGSAPITVTIH